ncbi:MAG: GLPGLI family protein [Bacteroidales bacterium]|nr:GLPGLI family protein [Bacteroidales bacterium]
MRRKLMTALLASMLTFSLGASGQSIHVVDGNTAGNDNSKQEKTIDQVQYRITYATKFVADTTKRDSTGNYLYLADEMRLDIGSTVGKFYSARKAIYDKWMDEKIARHDMDFSNPPAHPSLSWSVYRNYPAGETSFLTMAMMGSYRISEKTQVPDWSVATDTCTLLGYRCTKAETSFKGRHWTVWFTEDIPLDFGPWKLMGLPGLILKAADSQLQYVFEAKGLEQVGGKEDIMLVKDYKKYEPVTQKQLDKINRTTTADDVLKAAGITISMDNVKMEGGIEKDDFLKSMKQVSPYNPIEIVK